MELATAPKPKPRVIKPPAVRRAEMIDCAQALFLAKGYERTTISDVIAATGLSKGAFYHHFRAKEDLLEAIAERFAREALTQALDVQSDPSLTALDRLNRLLAMSRDWKAENIGPLRAMFTVLLRPENAILYHRIVEAVFHGMAPTVAAIIADGEREGVFSTPDETLAAEALRLTARHLLALRVIDEVIPEPLGGAHRDHREMATTLKGYLLRNLRELRQLSEEQLLEERYQKFRRMGVFTTGPSLNGVVAGPP